MDVRQIRAVRRRGGSGSSGRIELHAVAYEDVSNGGRNAMVSRTIVVDNLEINAVVPPEANAFNDNATTGGGRCGATPVNACNPRQVVLRLASVPAGQTVTVTMPPVVRPDVPPGAVVRLVGSMREPSVPRRVLAVDAVTVGGEP